jgi:AcrR family transcriptional regulator
MARKPVQKRSRATVEAIIEASFICVAHHGVANSTTAQIAEIAGIGIGSLYEYFANKQDVLAAMNQRFITDIEVLIRDMTPKVLNEDIETAVTIMFDGFIEFLTQNDSRYLCVIKEAFQPDTKDFTAPVNQALMDLLMQYIMTHPELMKMRNIPTMAYIIINSGIFLVLHHLGSERSPISFVQLREGLIDMVNAYVAYNSKN